MAKILLLNGPNLNLLGKREPEIYGVTTLQDIEADLKAMCRDLGHALCCLQSNAEHMLIDRLHKGLADETDFIIINPGPLTHTSIALRDGFLAVKIPFVEIHLSNTSAREPFRKNSYLSDIAIGTITGLGSIGYKLAVMAADEYLKK